MHELPALAKKVQEGGPKWSGYSPCAGVSDRVTGPCAACTFRSGLNKSTLLSISYIILLGNTLRALHVLHAVLASGRCTDFHCSTNSAQCAGLLWKWVLLGDGQHHTAAGVREGKQPLQS